MSETDWEMAFGSKSPSTAWREVDGVDVVNLCDGHVVVTAETKAEGLCE